MAVMTWTRKAKCKDCKFIKGKTFGRARRNICTNTESERHDPNPFLSRVALNDLVCDKWEMY